MTQNIATDRYQSQRLLDCGVDPKSADMCHIFFSQDGEQISQEEWLECDPEIDRGESYLIPKDFGMYDYSYSDDVPAWSLSALLALLPPEINDKGLQTAFQLSTYPDELKWSAEYYDFYMDKHLFNEIESSPSPIEACVRAIEWLCKNNYKLNDPHTSPC